MNEAQTQEFLQTLAKGAELLSGHPVTTALDVARAGWSAFQVGRFEHFRRSSLKALESDGLMPAQAEFKFLEMLNSPVGRDEMFKFVSASLAANSEIGRTALARLCMRSMLKEVPNISTEDSPLVQAYQTLSDADAKLMLYLEKRFPRHVSHSDTEKNTQPQGRLEVPFGVIDQAKAELSERFGVVDAIDLEDRLSNFGALGLYRIKNGMGSSFAVYMVRNRRTYIALADLRWAIGFIDPSSDLYLSGQVEPYSGTHSRS